MGVYIGEGVNYIMSTGGSITETLTEVKEDDYVMCCKIRLGADATGTPTVNGSSLTIHNQDSAVASRTAFRGQQSSIACTSTEAGSSISCSSGAAYNQVGGFIQARGVVPETIYEAYFESAGVKSGITTVPNGIAVFMAYCGNSAVSITGTGVVTIDNVYWSAASLGAGAYYVLTDGSNLSVTLGGTRPAFRVYTFAPKLGGGQIMLL